MTINLNLNDFLKNHVGQINCCQVTGNESHPAVPLILMAR